MASQYPWRATIRNEYLGVSKVVRAMTPQELQWITQVQLQKWSDQESRKRALKSREADRKAANQRKLDVQRQAEDDTKTAQESITRLRSVLLDGVARNPALNWDKIECHSVNP